MNVQWALFIAGLFLYLPSVLASFLPLCSQPKFPTRHHKHGWIANVVLSVAGGILLIIIIAVAASAANKSSEVGADAGAQDRGHSASNCLSLRLYLLPTGLISSPSCCLL